MIGIYKLTSPSGKCYIGQSVNIENRLSKYKHLKCESQPKIYNALVKYGYDNFTVEILWETKDELNSTSILNQLEEDFINLYDSVNNGYNCKEGGNSRRLSEETKNKLRNKFFSEEYRKKLSLAGKGRVFTEEHRKNLSESRKGKGHKHTEETKEKLSKIMTGKTRTKEHCENISKAKKGISNKLNYIPILQYDKNNNFIREWESITSAREELKISNISHCLSGKYKTSGGFIWKYKDDLVGMFKNMEDK